MNEHLIGIAASASTGIQPLELFPLLKQNGLEATFTALGSTEERRIWAEKIAAYGLVYTSIHAPFHKAADMWIDGLAGDVAEAEIAKSIDACHEVEVPILVVHPYIGFDQPYVPTEIGLKRFLRLAEQAEKQNVRIALENVEGEEYLSCLMQGLRDFDSVGFCLDTGHELCYNRGKDMLEEYGDRLCYLHINSNMGVTDPNGKLTWRDDSHMLPFDGKVDMENLANRLKACHYRGDLVMELVRGNKGDRHTNDAYLAMTDEEYIAEAAKRIKKLRDMIEG